MLRVHQSLSNKELSLRNKTMVDFYISVIKRYRKELLKLSTLIVADAYFSTSTFVNGIKKEGASLISRFRDNACLFYVYAGPRTGKRGRPKNKDGKIANGEDGDERYRRNSLYFDCLFQGTQV